MKRFGRVFLVLAGALAFSAGAAQAFTFTDQNGNTGPAQGYVDLESPSSMSRHDAPGARFGGDQGRLQSGNSSVQFNGGANSFGTFNQRYNSNNLFDPYAREGR